ncbi:MAG TPA: O-antigen ligase family protein [Kiloniellales bacterium]|nr:O-antigen ligase family protein [Kiloniellales bacterium]
MVKPLFWAFALAIALAPLPFGGNRPFAWSAIALTLGVLACLWGLFALFDRSLVTLGTRRVLPCALALLVLALWLALQASSLLPEALQHPAWHEMRSVLDVDVAGSLALAPDRAWTALMRLLSYAAAFWLALHLLRRRGLADRFLWLLVVAGVGYALYGLIVHLGGLREILWIDKYSYWESLTSTFINRNSYAAYAGMGLVVTVGLLLEQLRRMVLPAHLGWRGRLVHFLDHMGFGVWLLAAAFLVLLAALLLTGSRGGLLATLVGLVAVVFTVGGGGRKRLILAVVLLIALGGFVAMQSAALVERRLGQVDREMEGLSGSRLALYGLTLEAIALRPLAGSGLGSFPAIYLERRDEASGTEALNQVRVHNSYLEIALEAGVPAALLLFGTLGTILVLQLRSLPRAGVERRFAGIAAAATLLFAVHSLIDFPVQMPGIAVTFAALAGMGLAQSFPHSRPPKRPEVATERPWRGRCHTAGRR